MSRARNLSKFSLYYKFTQENSKIYEKQSVRCKKLRSQMMNGELEFIEREKLCSIMSTHREKRKL